MSEQPIAYEEVPGSRTTQQAIDQPQRERIAYEELQPGDIIQEGDEWQNECGRWRPFLVLDGSRVQVRQSQRVRRPYKIATMQRERDELRAEIQNLLRTITDNADQFADAGKILEHERDEARAERDRLQEVVGNLYSQPTARQVQDMLRTWATELDWSAGCFDSVGREQIDTIQKTLVAVIERIEGMVNPEGGSDE